MKVTFRLTVVLGSSIRDQIYCLAHGNILMVQIVSLLQCVVWTITTLYHTLYIWHWAAPAPAPIALAPTHNLLTRISLSFSAELPVATRNIFIALNNFIFIIVAGHNHRNLYSSRSWHVSSSIRDTWWFPRSPRIHIRRIPCWEYSIRPPCRCSGTKCRHYTPRRGCWAHDSPTRELINN